MSLDHQVSRLDHKDLSKQTQHLRVLGNILPRQKYFDIVDLLYHVVIPSLWQVGKRFRVEVADDLEEPAYVDLVAEVLHIAGWVLRAARAGDPRARLIIAHEIGHMILHRDQVMAFSDDKAVQLNYLQDEQSAEWQAHNFALLLLLPDEVIIDTRNLEPVTASIVIVLESKFISDRRFDYETQNKVSLEAYTGDQCQCGSLSVIQLAASTKCKTCGRTEP